MPIKSGLDYTENGLVFAFDTNDQPTSYLGEPTTNIAYAANNYLNSNGNWWFNSGSSILNDNDTSIVKPKIPNVDTSGLRIFSSEVTVTGNQHIGSAIIPISPNTQYTMSIYFWFQGSSMQTQPYLRTAVNNSLVVPFNYNGDTNYLNWPRQRWIRLSATYTTPANETGIYMTSYTGDYVGEKVAYFGYQVEQKPYMTPLVLGTRGVTSALLDVTGNSTIDLTRASYIDPGTLYFDGTNNWLTVDNGPLTQLTQNATLVAWFDWYGDTSAPHRTLICTSPTYRAGLKLMSYYHGSIAAWVGNNDGTADYLLGGGGTPSGWNMLACTRTTDGQLTLYLNGTQVASANTGFYGGTYLGSSPMIGGEYHSKYLGEIPMTQAYNRALSAPEILTIYNRTKSRYENRGCYLC